MGQFTSTLKGKIRINAPELAARYYLYPKLAAFSREHHEVQWSLCCDNQKVDIVAGRFDLGVRLGSDVAQDMVAVQISPLIVMSLVASADYLAQLETLSYPEALSHHHCIGS